jgi:Protein of unknown function (DUF2934)
MASAAVKMVPEWSTVSESAATTSIVSPTESEIATLAYQLWQANGCPVGLDREDWFRAEVILTNALIGEYEALLRSPSPPRRGPHSESEMLVGFDWEGHWEVWESEWRGARWVLDLNRTSVEVSRRAAAA